MKDILIKIIIKIKVFILNYICKKLVYTNTQLKSWHKNPLNRDCKSVRFNRLTDFLCKNTRFMALKRLKWVHCKFVSLYVLYIICISKFFKK